MTYDLYATLDAITARRKAAEERRDTDYIPAEQVQLAARLRQQKWMPAAAAEKEAARVAAAGQDALRGALDDLERERYGGETVAQQMARMTDTPPPAA